MIEKLSKLWAGAIAYVALALGAGASIWGNIVDTYTLRGAATDSLDIALAIFWPATVLLTVELFVSQLWSERIGYQILRWMGCLGIGTLAATSSWVHLNNLLTSRGQIMLVATGGPLAIDGLAVMATALLLSTRGRKAVANALDTWNPPAAVVPVATPGWTAEDDEAVANMSSESIWDRLGQELDTATTPATPLDVHPVSGPPALARSNEVKPESVPEGAREAFRAWLELDGHPERIKATEMYEAVGAAYGASGRTARRWFTAVKPTLV